MDFENEPATWKQLRYLRQHGHKPDRHLTKTAAAELIQSMGGTLAATIPDPAVIVSHLQRNDAHQLRTEVENALKAVADARKETLMSAEQALAIAVSKRQTFWIDTCRDPTQMQAVCGQVLEFYRKYGCRLEAPTHKQVREVLSALDTAVPQW